MKLVSIITPSYNQSSFLEETIRSVLEQKDQDVELVVVDGGSTDGSVDIIKKYADRLAWWVSEKDSGQADAINKGFVHAHGEIVAWLNSDDYYLPGAISAVVKAFAVHPEAAMIYGNMLAVDEHDQVINTLIYRQLSLEDLLCFQIVGQPAVFIRASAFRKAGGLDTSFHCLLDHQLWIKLAAYGEILHVPQTWAAARFHAAAKNRARAVEFGREAFRILEWVSSQPNLAAVLAHVSRRARASAQRVDARYLLDGGQPWHALQAWMRALVIHPPTALARLNLLGSALLDLMGLHALRRYILRQRQKHISS
jgi:glycosyltransferase involved in cell wall biosynthesis